jgi:hypothetical protein
MDYGALLQMAIGMFGEQAAKNLSEEQLRILKQQSDELRNIELPDLRDIVAEEMGPTAMEEVRSDPEQRAQQLQVMQELRDIFEGGGFNIEDEAALNEAFNRSNVAGNAQRKALASEYAQRGQLGSGARLAAGNMQAQGAANRSSQTALDIGAMGQRRRADALNRYGAMASGLRSQDFGESAQRAAAKDAATRWNAAARERAGYYNAGLPQQQFNNRMSKVTGQQAGSNNLASYYANESQGVRNQYANYGQAGAEAARGLGNTLKGVGSGSSNGPKGYDADGTPYYSDPDEWDLPY